MLLRDTFHSVMKQHDFDPHTMAVKLGVTTNTIWRYLAGKVSPSTVVLTRLAQLGHLDFAELLAQKASEANAQRMAVQSGAIKVKAGKLPVTPQRPYQARSVGLKLSEGDMKEIMSMLLQVSERLSALEQRLSANPSHRVVKNG